MKRYVMHMLLLLLCVLLSMVLIPGAMAEEKVQSISYLPEPLRKSPPS